MHRFIAGLSMLGLLLFGTVGAIAAAPPSPADPAGREQDIRGVVHPRNTARRSGGTTNLVYHTGGAVQTGTHHTYAIYWGTSFSGTYQTTINQFFKDVAADSGKTTNVYSSDTQYSQTIGGATTFVTYSEAFGGAWSDPVLPSTSGCTSTAGGSLCVSDAQMQAEITRAIAANASWSTGMDNEFFVFLADGASTCAGSSCAFSQFCAYHTHYVLNGATVLYANMPYTGHNLSACGTGQYPNGDPAADSTLNVTSHEANETITDALGNAWYDQQGNENGDKCAWNFGAAQGTVGAQYNQLIGTGHYFLQQEWSNRSTGCVQQGT